ncbi:MAG: hemoglobin/transferrin/lactoferrin receptor protein, partial [Bacteroidia bacterium]
MQKALLILFLVGLSQILQAQFIITGTVKDDTGLTLPGATVTIKGTTQGTVTDIDGKYKLKFPNAETILVFRFTGMIQKEVAVWEKRIGVKSVIDVNLESHTVIYGMPPIVYYAYVFPKYFSHSLYKTKSSNPQNLTKTFQNSHQVYAPTQQANGGFISVKGFQAQQSAYYLDGIRLISATLNPQNTQILTAFHPELLSKVSIGSRWQSSIGENVYLDLADANSHNVSMDYAIRYASANNEQMAHASVKYGKKKWKGLTAISFSKFGDWRSGKKSNSSNGFEWKHENEASQVNGTDLLTPTEKPYLQSPNDFNSLCLTQKVVYDSKKSKHELIFNYARFSELSNYGRLREDSIGKFSNTNLRFAEFGNPTQSRLLLAYKLGTEFIWDSRIDAQVNYQNSSEGQNYRLFGSKIRNSFTENTNAYGGKLAWSKNFNRLKFSLSNRFSYNQLSANSENGNLAINSGSILRTRYADGSSILGNLTTLDLSYNAGNDWDLYGYFQLHNSKIKTRTPVFGNLVEVGDFEQNYFAPTWGLQVEKYLDFINFASVNIQTKFNSSFRAPNLYELASIQLLPASNHLLVQSLELQPEKAYNFEFATDFNLGDFNLTARYFHSWINDLIQLRPTISNLVEIDEFKNQSLLAFAHSNISKSQIYGFSIQTSYSLHEINTTISAGMTYVEGKNESEENEPLAGIAPLSGLASIGYRHKSLKMNHQFSFQFNNEKSLDEFANNSANRKNYFLGSEGAPSWQTLNYRVEWEANKKIKLQFAMENILDT